MRTDAAIARLQLQLNQFMGGNKQLSDYMPWPAENDEEATVDDIVGILTGAVK